MRRFGGLGQDVPPLVGPNARTSWTPPGICPPCPAPRSTVTRRSTTDSMMPLWDKAQVKHLALVDMLISWVSLLSMEVSTDHQPFLPDTLPLPSQQSG